MLAFGQVSKFSHFYPPDFPLGKSATNLNGQIIHKTDKHNSKKRLKVLFFINRK